MFDDVEYGCPLMANPNGHRHFKSTIIYDGVEYLVKFPRFPIE